MLEGRFWEIGRLDDVVDRGLNEIEGLSERGSGGCT